MMWIRRQHVPSRRHVARRHCAFESLESRLALSGTPPTVVDVTVCSTDWSENFLSYLEAHSLGTDGYSVPVGSTAQSAPLPWKNVDQIRITFSEDVDVQMADMSLSGVNTAEYELSGFFYDPQSHVATWTLASPIAADRLRIDLDANGVDPVQDLDGNVLDGEWEDEVSTYSSGNGTAGGDFEFIFELLPGDINGTELVNYLDYVYTRALVGKSSSDPGYIPFRDIDGDGLIESSDWLDVLSFLWDQVPVGIPAGANNDAPTTEGLESISIDDDTIDVAISLWDAFGDAEDSASGLTYSIEGNSNPSLFDLASIDPSSGNLTVNAASGATGRATLTISATDASGLSVRASVGVDVNYQNQPPVISDFTAVLKEDNIWAISGQVADPDDDTTGWIISLFELFDARAVVSPEGQFELSVQISPEEWGWERCITHDPHGLASNIPSTFIGLT